MIADATGVVVMKTCPRTTSDNTPGGSPASTPARQSGRSVLILLVGAAALVMGAGTLGGSFVGGDDHRLLLNHVLVNHPSLSHALKLFTIWHRDLYQPLPLLSFQLEFAVARALGLFDRGVEGGQWLFHLTNVLLHAANTILVWLVIHSLHARVETADGTKQDAGLATGTAVGDRTAPPGGLRSTSTDRRGNATLVATITALFFAVHPLQTEVVAWTNGRMMLLSTLFALLSLRSYGRWLDDGRRRSAVGTLLFVTLCAISKVRIGLPVLLLIVVWSRRARLNRRSGAILAAAGVITAAFVVLNVMSTAGADLFSAAAEHLAGPRLVRVGLALAWYMQHLVWPVGLSSYYPTPPTVHWSDSGNVAALAIVLLAALILGWTCRRFRAARWGLLWFASTIASTLPFVPARNILAADRYMYLPIIGLLWLVSAMGCHAFHKLIVRPARSMRRAGSYRVAAAAGTGGLVVVCMVVSWHVAWFYTTPLRKTERIASLFPTTPRVWERLGWSYYRQGDYDRAIECATRELRHDSAVVRSAAYQLRGMSELRLGRHEAGLALLHRALAVDPDSALGQYRLALAYDRLGRPADAIPHYEAAVAASPGHNPTINRLAEAYQRVGRLADARKAYEKSLANNPGYEVDAILGLAALDIQEGSTRSYLLAKRRLTDLLAWMPENVAARVNLGVVRSALGQQQPAMREYRLALDQEPSNVTALLNLGQLEHAAGREDRAAELFRRALDAGLQSPEQAVVVHDFLLTRSKISQAVDVWRRVVDTFPDSMMARGFLAWSHALNGQPTQAKEVIAELSNEPGDGFAERPIVVAALAYLSFVESRYEPATRRIATLCRQRDAAAKDARQRLLGAFERFDTDHPNRPWTYCLTARLLIAEGRLKAAGVFVGLCRQWCPPSAPCQGELQTLRSQMEGRTAPGGASGHRSKSDAVR